METITIGRVSSAWKPLANALYYAQRGEGEEYAFGRTAAEALASLEKREAEGLVQFDRTYCEEVAFLALGAADSFREVDPPDLDRFGGYMGYIADVIRHAPMLMDRWQKVGPEGFGGTWLYEVTERFGREWGSVLLSEEDRRPADLLDQIIKEAL